MTKIKYDMSLMRYISLFSNITSVKVKDCFLDNDCVVFIVDGNIARAIGKKGMNAKKISQILNKKIRIIEFSGDVLQFIRNLVAPLEIKEIKEEEKVITITGPDVKTKGLLIGRDSRNLNNLKEVVKRYFDIDDMKVV